MMRKFTVTANVDSQKFGKGRLIAHLDEHEIVEYANLQDNSDRLAYLKAHGAKFEVDLEGLDQADVKEFSVERHEERPLRRQGPAEAGQVSRKMRMNINGQDTGWVDVTPENEAQYNQLMQQFNESQKRFNQRFAQLFNWSSHPLLDLDFDHPLLDNGNAGENKEETEA